MTKEYSDFLAHHGIQGMRWHVRRYQDLTGKLTPEGKARYQKNDSSSKKEKKKEKPESSTWKSSDAKYLSDDELNRRNSRLQRENQYKQLTESTRHKALRWIGRTASTILVVTAIGAAKGKMAGVYSKGLTTLATKASELIKKNRGAAVSSLFSLGLKG